MQGDLEDVENHKGKIMMIETMDGKGNKDVRPLARQFRQPRPRAITKPPIVAQAPRLLADFRILFWLSRVTLGLGIAFFQLQWCR